MHHLQLIQKYENNYAVPVYIVFWYGQSVYLTADLNINDEVKSFRWL